MAVLHMGRLMERHEMAHLVIEHTGYEHTVPEGEGIGAVNVEELHPIRATAKLLLTSQQVEAYQLPQQTEQHDNDSRNPQPAEQPRGIVQERRDSRTVGNHKLLSFHLHRRHCLVGRISHLLDRCQGGLLRLHQHLNGSVKLHPADRCHH